MPDLQVAMDPLRQAPISVTQHRLYEPDIPGRLIVDLADKLAVARKRHVAALEQE